MIADSNSDQNICVVTRPSSELSYATPIYRFGRILSPAANNLYLITGSYIASHSPEYFDRITDIGKYGNIGIRYIGFLTMQIKISLAIVSTRESVDLVYFHKGAMGMALPVIVARVVGIDTCVIKIGAYADERAEDPGVVDRLYTWLQLLSFRVAHSAVVFTPSECTSVPNTNTFVAYSNYRDFNTFCIEKNMDQRSVDIGFVGRFDEDKGVDMAIKAVVSIAEKNPDLSVRMIGDGPLYDFVEKKANKYDNIQLTGWVEHDEISEYYKDIRILLAPSRAEGLPTTLIEAMGCGVIVVTTPVGGVFDLIKDGGTGFILSEFSVREITSTLEKIQDKEQLEEISKKARGSVSDKYTHQAAIERFEIINRRIAGYYDR